SDSFDGTTLDTCRWNAIVRGDTSGYSVSGGALHVITGPGDIFQTPNTGPSNLILQTAPSGDWTIETEVIAPLLGNNQHVDLVAYQNDDNYVKLGIVAPNGIGSTEGYYTEIVSEVGGVLQYPHNYTYMRAD